MRTVGFWLQLGLDGFRVDGVPFFEQSAEATGSPEYVVDPHRFMRQLRDFLSRRNGSAMMLGEVNLPHEQQLAFSEAFGVIPSTQAAAATYRALPAERPAVDLTDLAAIVDTAVRTQTKVITDLETITAVNRNRQLRQDAVAERGTAHVALTGGSMGGAVVSGLADLAREGMTMLVVSHEMGFARKVADRVLFMADGAIVEDASPEDFFTSPTSSRAKDFLGKILAH